jgi:hypothetical protein
VGDRIARDVAKYRHAREALIALKGEAFAPQFRELRSSDMNTNLEEESDGVARKKLGWIGSSKRARNETLSSKKLTFSWLWTVGGGPGEDNQQLHECESSTICGAGSVADRLQIRKIGVRVDWSKAKARRDRWVEEVMLLREEMKRVLRMLHWEQGVWRDRATARSPGEPELAAGLKAYAARQTDLHHRIATGFFGEWNRSVATAVRDAVRQDGTVYRDLLEGRVDSAMEVELDAVEQAIAAERMARASETGDGDEVREGQEVQSRRELCSGHRGERRKKVEGGLAAGT